MLLVIIVMEQELNIMNQVNISVFVVIDVIFIYLLLERTIIKLICFHNNMLYDKPVSMKILGEYKENHLDCWSVSTSPWIEYHGIQSVFPCPRWWEWLPDFRYRLRPSMR